MANQNYDESAESDSESYYSDDSEEDPDFDCLEATRSTFSKFYVKKGKSNSGCSVINERNGEDAVDAKDVHKTIAPVLDEKDQKSFESLQKIIQAGQLEKLKVDQCKTYLKKHGLRLTGKKDTLIDRIKEHIGIVNGEGESYPASSFVIDCKGDACTGDIVMFEQNVYETFSIVSRSASGPPCGTRVVAGRIVKESYGAAKQQHTFTIEVLWSRGMKPLPPLHPLLIKGRNLYRLKTMRQRWEDECKRQKILLEKHNRGFVARSNREARIQEKEMRKIVRENRMSRMKSQNKKQEENEAKAGKQDLQVKHVYAQPIGSADPSNQICVKVFQPRNFAQSSLFFPPEWHQYKENMHSNILHIPFGVGKRQGSYPLEVPQLQRRAFPKTNNGNAMRGPTGQKGSEPRPRCRYYAQGRCHYGNNCKYLH